MNSLDSNIVCSVFTMNFFTQFIFTLLVKLVTCGIDVPRDECTWLDGRYGVEVKCDGNQVVVGACGAGHYADCPNGAWHQILCCSLPMFYYEKCVKFGTQHGELNSCLEHGNLSLMLEDCEE